MILKFLYFLKFFSKKEKIFLLIFLSTFLISFFFLTKFFFLKFTKSEPAKGGELIEGVLGTPNFLVSIYDPLSEPDELVSELISTSLLKYENGVLVLQLAKEIKILDEGKTYEIELRDDAFWEDGEKITADDVIFTIETVKNQEVKSPYYSFWLGTKVVGLSEKKLRIQLRSPSFSFYSNLTLKILPKHYLEKIQPKDFPFLVKNIRPLASGPFKIEKIKRNENGEILEISFVENEKYFGKKPYLKRLKLKFFDSEKKLFLEAKKGNVDGFSLNFFSEIPNFQRMKEYQFLIPRYIALFFNLEKDVFSRKEVREALNLATDKRRILKEVFSQRGKIIESPFLDEIFEFKQGKSEYNLEKAKEILEKAGFYLNEEGIRQKEVKEERRFEKELKIGSLGNEVKSLQECLKKEGVFFGKVNGIFDREVKEALILFQQKYAEDILKPSGLKKATGKMGELTIKKLNEVCFERKPPILLKFKILTLKDEKFEKIANILKEDWEKLGVKVEIETIDINSLKSDILAKKNYDAILLGQAFGAILDPYYFWHSSQKEEFGLNLSKFEKKELDEILEKLRENFNENQRKELLEKAKEIILNERPAIFLISPKYCYFLNEKVKGVKESIILNGAQRFENITDWYIKERKVFSK